MGRCSPEPRAAVLHLRRRKARSQDPRSAARSGVRAARGALRAVVTAEQLLDAINRAGGTNYRLAGRFARGESGAFRIVGESGKEWVFKFGEGAEFKSDRAASITTRLRELGYPAPIYLAYEK